MSFILKCLVVCTLKLTWIIRNIFLVLIRFMERLHCVFVKCILVGTHTHPKFYFQIFPSFLRRIFRMLLYTLKYKTNTTIVSNKHWYDLCKHYLRFHYLASNWQTNVVIESSHIIYRHWIQLPRFLQFLQIYSVPQLKPLIRVCRYTMFLP